MRSLSYGEGQIFSFGPNLKPVAAMDPGERIEVICQDSCGEQIHTEGDLLTKIDLKHVNGATGPIEVRGAKAGDALRVQILDIRVEKEGYVGIEPKLGVLGDRIEEARTKIIPIRNGMARFSRDVHIPIRPLWRDHRGGHGGTDPLDVLPARP